MSKPDPSEVHVQKIVEEARDSLNAAEAEGYLSTVGAEARKLCIEALDMVTANGGRWDEASANKVRAARDALARELQTKRVGELAPRHAHTCTSEAVHLLNFYLGARNAQRRRELKKAVSKVTGASSANQDWSKRAERMTQLRGTTDRKKGMGF
jgi:hypothetical protein